MSYLVNLILQIFCELFELRTENHAQFYVNHKQEFCDDDLTLSAVIKHLIDSKQFDDLKVDPLTKGQHKEYKANRGEKIVEFIKTHDHFRGAVYKKKAQTFLKNWRIKPFLSGDDDDEGEDAEEKYEPYVASQDDWSDEALLKEIAEMNVKEESEYGGSPVAKARDDANEFEEDENPESKLFICNLFLSCC